MSKASIKPKATVVWSEQTEKLKQKLLTITGLNGYFEQGKMEVMFQRIHDRINSSNHKLEIATKL